MTEFVGATGRLPRQQQSRRSDLPPLPEGGVSLLVRILRDPQERGVSAGQDYSLGVRDRSHQEAPGAREGRGRAGNRSRGRLVHMGKGREELDSGDAAVQHATRTHERASSAGI